MQGNPLAKRRLFHAAMYCHIKQPPCNGRKRKPLASCADIPPKSGENEGYLYVYALILPLDLCSDLCGKILFLLLDSFAELETRKFVHLYAA